VVSLQTISPRTPKGQPLELEIGGRRVAAFVSVHHSGAGPGILLLPGGGIDPCMRARADLFGEEGYCVLAMDLGDAASTGDVTEAANLLRAMPQMEGKTIAIGHGSGGALALAAAPKAGFDCVVAFDAAGVDEETLSDRPCPVALLFGTMGSADAAAEVQRLSADFNRKDGSGIYEFADAAPQFSLPGRGGWDKRVDSLAHSRALEIMRRIAGPYYDLVGLFADHVRHEFETLDVDATMATMVDEPYVNHVPTLSGGVGHDLLKRFYKYHFIGQNAKQRDSVTVSQTIGPDRIVLESVVRFRHDAVIDRMFSGIEPTGKYVEMALVLLVKFRGDRVCHEHIHWDQGSVLAQIGVLDATNLPIAGPEAAHKLLDETLPSNQFMLDVWATSEGKPL
jgi:carboxymethylenebutenolidase